MSCLEKLMLLLYTVVGCFAVNIVIIVEPNHPVQVNHELYQYVFSEDTKLISPLSLLQLNL